MAMKLCTCAKIISLMGLVSGGEQFLGLKGMCQADVFQVAKIVDVICNSSLAFKS